MNWKELPRERPLLKWKITDTFHMPSRPTHQGVDLCGSVEDVVINMFKGIIQAIYKSDKPGGWTVDVRTNYDGGFIRLTYSHLTKLRVTVGQKVIMGQVLGVLGAYPPEKPRPHIHLQLWDKGWVDPEKELDLPKEWGYT